MPVDGVLREHSDDGDLSRLGWRGDVWSAEATLRVDGGPDRMTLHVALVSATSFASIH